MRSGAFAGREVDRRRWQTWLLSQQSAQQQEQDVDVVDTKSATKACCRTSGHLFGALGASLCWLQPVGIVMLLVGVVGGVITCDLPRVMSLIGLIEGVIYLTKLPTNSGDLSRSPEGMVLS